MLRKICILAIPFLPLPIFLIPHAFTLFPELRDPWYTKYTSLPWILSALYVYPATAVTTLLGLELFTVAHVVITLMYVSFVSYAIYRIKFRDSN